MVIFRCEECEKNFPDERALEQHNGQKHDEEKNRAKAEVEAAKEVAKPKKNGLPLPILIISALVVLGIFVFVLFPMLSATPLQNSDADLSSVELKPAPVVREITMVARQWAFEPGTITVNQGDTVKLTIESIDVSHGFVITAFGIDEQLTPEETIDIEFVADKKGAFRFFCNVQCGQGHSSMSGLLIVK